MKPTKFSTTRTSPRIHAGLPVLLRFGWEYAEEARATVVDISEGGLSVHWHHPLRVGMEVKVILENALDDAKVYRVVWVREAESAEHGFDIGLELKPHQPGPAAQ